MEAFHLEGFSETLRGRILWTSAAISAGRFAAIDQETAHRARHVFLIHGNTVVPKWVFSSPSVRMDFFIRIFDTTDLKLALTYIQSRSSPMTCVWIGAAEPPKNVVAFLQKLSHVSTVVITPTPLEDYDAVFWSPDTAAEEIESYLIRKMGSKQASAIQVATVLKETRASNVGLVWTRIGEAASGNVYWFDPAEYELGGGDFQILHVPDQLRELADKLQKSFRK